MIIDNIDTLKKYVVLPRIPVIKNLVKTLTDDVKTPDAPVIKNEFKDFKGRASSIDNYFRPPLRLECTSLVTCWCTRKSLIVELKI